MAEEITDPLSKKIAITPDQTIFTDGAIAPIGNFRMPLKNPVEGNCEAVMPFDPATGKYVMPCVLKNAGNTLVASIDILGNNPGQTIPALTVKAQINYYNNVSTALEVIRTPTKYYFATCAAATGATVIWSPAAGKKFRLMGLIICPSGTAAAAGLRTFSIEEETLGQIMAASVIAPAAGVGCNAPICINLPGNGYLATTADKDLIITTGTTAYNVGSDAVTAWGTEE
jgi:hypothetical protein